MSETFTMDELRQILKERQKAKKKYSEYGSQMKEKKNNMSNCKQRLFRPGTIVKNGKAHGVNVRKGRFDSDEWYNENES